MAEHRVTGTFGSAFGLSAGCMLGIVAALLLVLGGSVAICFGCCGGLTWFGAQVKPTSKDLPTRASPKGPIPREFQL